MWWDVPWSSILPFCGYVISGPLLCNMSCLSSHPSHLLIRFLSVSNDILSKTYASINLHYSFLGEENLTTHPSGQTYRRGVFLGYMSTFLWIGSRMPYPLKLAMPTYHTPFPSNRYVSNPISSSNWRESSGEHFRQLSCGFYPHVKHFIHIISLSFTFVYID